VLFGILAHQKKSMEIRIPKNSTTRDEVLATLQSHFSDCKVVANKSKYVEVLSKDTPYGCKVDVGKKSFYLSHRFTSKWKRFFWILSLCLTGVILPLLFYAFFRLKGMNRLRKEVAGVLRDRFAS